MCGMSGALDSDVLGFEPRPCTGAWPGALNPLSGLPTGWDNSTYLVELFLAKDMLSV